jgi:hypothetical protein
MTERWRKKLRDLDATGPTNDVFERAKTGPTRHEDELTAPGTSTRIVTGVVAFAIFALALGVVAVPAFRMNGNDTGSGSLGMFPIWPAQDAKALADLQATADRGDAGWLLDPSTVAQRFGSDVLGWDRTEVEPAISKYCSPNQQLWSPSWGEASISPGPPSCASGVTTTPNAAAPTPVVGAFPVVGLMECSGDVCTGGGETLQLFQPVTQGPGGIWAVLSAFSPSLDLSVTPGQTVRGGATISANVPARDLTSFVPTLAYASCGSSGAGAPSGMTSSSWGSQFNLSIDVQLDPAAGCGGEQPGYAWVAEAETSFTTPDGSLQRDPLATPGAHVSFLTAVPIVAVFPQSAAPAPTADPTGEPAWSNYSDPLGWTVDVPPGWTTETWADAGAGFTGDGITVQITRGGEQRRDDSSFPLDPDGFLSEGEGALIGSFHGDALPFKFVVMGDGMSPPVLTQQQQLIVDRMIESVRFERWKIGETRNGYSAIGHVHASSSAEWFYAVTGDGENAFSTYVDGERMVYGPVYSCPGARYEVREYGVAAMRCADGSDNAWDFEGRPQPGNAPDYAHRLDGFPAIRSWDGYLLVDLHPAEP